jgi:lipopolysaccharide/colanic/teichoic acid biosynthesis glycosyltransferase
VLTHEGEDAQYRGWIHGLCPIAGVAGAPDQFAEALASHELSDALLIVDPRCMPVGGFQFSTLVHHYAAEPRVALHSVAFEAGIAGTKERVCFDSDGQIRKIQRYYATATWPFVSGISATVVPSACGVLTDGLVPRSLAELRQALMARGVPSRDVPVEGGAFDLSAEGGMLAANEQFVLNATSAVPAGQAAAAPIYIGNGHSVHATARFVGSVVIHPDVRIDERVTIVGPAVIGTGSRIAAGAVVAHATIGADCFVPADRIVRDRAWFESEAEIAPSQDDPEALSYGERLARLTVDSYETAPPPREPRRPGRRLTLGLKRALDIAVSASLLTILSPVLAVVAALIRLESKGPIFYGDKREGLRGRVFGCWKFRTMYTGAHLAQIELNRLDHTDGPHFKVDRDPRVTRLGRLLRAINLDEIPQLINVLTGQMSLVGPRPSPFRENQICVPWREGRLSVRPGITGLWQVCRHDRSAGDFHQWIEYDLLYVQHLSFWLDLKILAATLITLGGKTHVPAPWLIRAASSEAGIGPATVERLDETSDTERVAAA